MSNDQHQHFLSVNELAERYGLTRSTIYAWMQKGTGPTSLRIGRHVRFRLTDVLSWEEAQERQRHGGWEELA